MSAHKPIPVDRVDWFRVLTDLRRSGMALPLISAVVLLSKTKLLDLRNLGAEPKHAPGERLLALWMRQTGLPREGIPKLSQQYFKHDYEVRQWDGGTRHCPTCGREHAPMAKKQIKASTSPADQNMPLFGGDRAPH